MGVDPTSRRELWKMVQALADEGIAVLWSTSYPDEAELCGSVILLNEGICCSRDLRGDDRASPISEVAVSVRDGRRRILARALQHESVVDGVIQGERIRHP